MEKVQFMNPTHHFGCPPNDAILWVPLVWEMNPETKEKSYSPAIGYGYTCRESCNGALDINKFGDGKIRNGILDRRIAFIGGAAITIAGVPTHDKPTYNISKGQKAPGTIKEMISGIKLAVSFLNSMEKKAGWEKTTASEIAVNYLIPKSDKYTTVFEHDSIWWIFDGDRRWFANPYMMSLFQLIIRLFFVLSVWRMPGLTYKIIGWKSGFEILDSIDKNNPRHISVKEPRPSDLNHFRATHKFWLPLMLKYKKIFGHIDAATVFDSQKYAPGYLNINGINYLVGGYATLKGVKSAFANNSEAMLAQYKKLMVRKPKKIREKSDEADNRG